MISRLSKGGDMKPVPKRPHKRRALPPIGTRLKGRYLKINYTAEIVSLPSTADGRGVKYRKKVFPSMSAAAEAITNHSTNGWRFWKIDGHSK
jgi:hypothetical protein